MKKIVLCTILLILGCAKEDILELKKEGYVSFTASIAKLDETSKKDVPECSNKTPGSVEYRLINSDGFVFTSTSDIIINNNTIEATDKLAFPVGNYTIDEISLYDADGFITHTVPHELDSRFSFYRYFDNYLPSVIKLLPGETTNSPDFSLVCYTEQEIQYGELGSGLGIDDLETLFYIINETQNCLATVTIQVDFGLIQTIPVTQTGLYAIPIPADHSSLSLRGYDANGNVRQVLNLNLPYDQRVFMFQPNCN